MVPAYNPRRDYLEETLRNVLSQDPGPEKMQLEVVDDCSPDVDVEMLVKAIAGERVAFSKTLGNLGLAGCWNACIERSVGEWVHILHQDDMVSRASMIGLRPRRRNTRK
jgi:glycosyltransferase involved in cell wall biosynthesis